MYGWVGTKTIPKHLNCQLTSDVWLLRMLEAQNYAAFMAQPSGLCQEVKKDHPLRASTISCKLCSGHVGLSVFPLVKVVVIRELVNWTCPKLTNTDLKWLKISLLWKTNGWMGKIIALTLGCVVQGKVGRVCNLFFISAVKEILGVMALSDHKYQL